jgi:preprotein translocase subunit SecG
VAQLILLVVVSVCVVVCVLCSNQQPDDCTFLGGGRNFFQFCNNTTDGYLRFISTVIQTTVSFFFGVVIFFGCNLNPPKTWPARRLYRFFLAVFYLVVCKYHNWCLCRNTNTNYDPKNIRPEKRKRYSHLAGYVFQTTRKNYNMKKRVQLSDRWFK